MTTLDEIRVRADRAADEIIRLASAQPANAWKWSIPSDAEKDSDLILLAPIYDIAKLLTALAAALAEHQPMTWTWVGVGPIQACETCSSEAVTVEQAEYPCPTVRAITPALEGGAA